MKIAISKSQFDLLTKRNAAKSEAESKVVNAQLLEQSAVIALNDCIIQLLEENEIELSQDMKPSSIKANKDGTFELEIIETKKDN